MDKQNQTIVGIGACVMDTLIRVSTYPQEDTKMQALGSKASGGGPVATGLVAAGKLGVKASYIGVLAEDASGNFLKQDFEKYGVGTSYIRTKSGFRSFTSTILLSQDSKSRTCVFDRGDLPALTLDAEQKQAISDAKLLMVDGNELQAAVEAANIARQHGVPVLYDAGGLYKGVESLLALTDYLIPSEEFARKHSGCQTVEEAAEWLYEKYRPQLVVVTCGKEGGVLYDGASLVHYPAFAVDAVDTNGAGDVFHGAFAAGLIKGYRPLECCYYASATSALKCTGIGARESVPDSQSVIGFLKENGYEL